MNGDSKISVHCYLCSSHCLPILYHHTFIYIYHAGSLWNPGYIAQAFTFDMSEDILHHKPARPSTVIPGLWLINLPPDCPIRIQRYRLPVEHTDNREQALLENPLEVQWRTINSSGDGVLKDILAGGCATITDGGSERERELWVFSTSTAPDSSSLLECKLDLLYEIMTRLTCRHFTRSPPNHLKRITRMLKTRVQSILPLPAIYKSTSQYIV